MRSNQYLLQRESEFVLSGQRSFENYLDFVKTSGKHSGAAATTEALKKDNAQLDFEIAELKARLASSRQQREDIQDQRRQFSRKIHTSQIMVEALTNKANQLEYENSTVLDEIASIDESVQIAVSNFDRYKQINTLNDAFYVWYTGPFATINCFKLGNLVNKPVEFTEINAALGQAALVLSIITSRCGIQFKQFHIAPMGSFARLLKADDRRTSYPLFIDQGSFSLFPKRNFNLALSGFMQCIHELGEHISSYDPTLSIPYQIHVSDSKIADKSFVYGGDEEVWTHALKHMLANIKWIIAWYCKHGHY